LLSGPAVTFYAIIALGHQYRLVPLTSTLSCVRHANDGADREKLYTAFEAAHVLLAEILKDSTKYSATPPRPIPAGCHRFPAVTQLQRYPHNEGSEEDSVDFSIRKFHASRQNDRWVYLATISDQPQISILVKFTRWYSVELHNFCQRSGNAPRIFGFERLPGGWYGIAMEYLESARSLFEVGQLWKHGFITDAELPGSEWVQELQALVSAIHDRKLVHGDLRAPNILYNRQKPILIDFDWGGEAGKARYPVPLDQLNDDLVGGRNNMDDVLISPEGDMRVLRNSLSFLSCKNM